MVLKWHYLHQQSYSASSLVTIEMGDHLQAHYLSM